MNRRGVTGIDWMKYAAVTITVLGALGALWIALRYGTRVLMPFLLACVLSLLLDPLAVKISRRTKIPRKLTATVLLLLTLALLVFTVIFAFGHLFREIEELFRFLAEDSERVGAFVQSIVDFFASLSERIPFLSVLEEVDGLEGISESAGQIVTEFFRETLTGLSAQIPALVGSIVRGTPGALLFLLVFLISSFYFCLDGDRIYRGIRSVLPASLSERLRGARTRITSLLYRYLRVYFVIFMITFTELLIGFMLLGRQYAFLLALLISAMDILPVLGVGTVLAPWAAFLFVSRDYFGAIGLLILWGVITLVRQIIEPRLIGDSFGMHPLLALVALYAGLKLFGFLGLLLGPAIAVFAKLVYTELRPKSAARE